MAIIGTGGGNASFSQLENHIAAGGNITTGWNASTQVLTVSATGFTGNNIAGASDVTITSVTNGQVLLRSGNVWINKTVSGDVSISTNGNVTLTAISGSKLVANTITARELNVSGNGTSGQVFASNGDGSFRWEDAGGGDSVFSRGDITAGSNITITNSGTDGIVISASIGSTVSALKDLSDVSTRLNSESNTILVRPANNSAFHILTMTGDISWSASVNNSHISASINDSTITSAKLSSNVVISSLNDVSATSFADGDVLIASGSTLVKGTISAGSNVTVTKASGLITISATGGGGGGGTNITVSDTPTINLTLSGGTLSANVINNSITGTQISANLQDLTNVNLSNTRAAGQIPILDSADNDGVFYNYGLSGDVSMTYSGVVTISSKKVTTAKMHGGTTSGRLLGTGSATDGTVSPITLSAGDNISVTNTNNVITISGQASGGSSFERSDIHAGNNISLTNSGTEGVIISASLSSLALGNVTHSASQSGKVLAVTGSGTSDIAVVPISGSGTVSVSSTSAGIVISGTSSGGSGNNFTFKTAKTFTSDSTDEFYDFTDISSDAKRITIIFNNILLQLAARIGLRIGDSGGIETTNYKSKSEQAGGGSEQTSTNRFEFLSSGTNAGNNNGKFVLERIGTSSNTWVCTGLYTNTNSFGNGAIIAGSKTLSGTLDRVRILTNAGDFRGGTVQCIVETGAAGSGGSSTLSALTDTAISSPSNNQVLTYNGTNWVNATPSGGAVADPGITTVINFGNDTTSAIAVGDFVASLDGIGNNAIAGEEATSASKVPIGIAVKAIAAKANSGADEVVVNGSVLVMGAYNPPSGDIDGNFTGATDRQAVYLKFVTNAWKFTLETTKYRVGTHHNGDIILDFVGMENINDIADDIVDVIPAFSGEANDSQDGLIIDDNGVAKRIGWKDFEADVEPIHTKEQLTLTGYVYSSQDPNNHALVAGEFHLRANADLSSVSLLGVAKAGDEAQFRALMTPGFQLEIESGSGNNRIWVIGVVGTSAVAGNAAQVNFVQGSVTKSTANFSNDSPLTFNSYGRTVNWRNLEYERVPSDGYNSRKIASTQWTRNFFLDQEATLAEAASGANVDKFISPSINNQTFLLLNGASQVTGLNSIASGTPSNNQFVWNGSNGYLVNIGASVYPGVASRVQAGFRYEIINSALVVVERGLIVSHIRIGTNSAITINPSSVWQMDSSHRGSAGTGYTFRFIGAAAYSGEERERQKIQTCQAAYGVNERTQNVNTRFRSTFNSGDGRIGRLGDARRLLNLTLCEHLNVTTGSGEASHSHLGFRAVAGHLYDVSMTIGGVWGFGNPDAAVNYGLDFGLQYSFKATNTATWGSWQDCKVGTATSGTFNYNGGNFGLYQSNGTGIEPMDRDNIAGNNNRFCCLLKAKWNSPSEGAFLDTALPATFNFGVGGTSNAFRNTADMDIRFRPVYCPISDRQIEAVYIANGTLKAIRND